MKTAENSQKRESFFL